MSTLSKKLTVAALAGLVSVSFAPTAANARGESMETAHLSQSNLVKYTSECWGNMKCDESRMENYDHKNSCNSKNACKGKHNRSEEKRRY